MISTISSSHRARRSSADRTRPAYGHRRAFGQSRWRCWPASPPVPSAGTVPTLNSHGDANAEWSVTVGGTLIRVKPSSPCCDGAPPSTRKRENTGTLSPHPACSCPCGGRSRHGPQRTRKAGFLEACSSHVPAAADDHEARARPRRTRCPPADTGPPRGHRGARHLGRGPQRRPSRPSNGSPDSAWRPVMEGRGKLAASFTQAG